MGSFFLPVYLLLSPSLQLFSVDLYLFPLVFHLQINHLVKLLLVIRGIANTYQIVPRYVLALLFIEVFASDAALRSYPYVFSEELFSCKVIHEILPCYKSIGSFVIIVILLIH